MRRRDFIALFSGAAIWPLAALAQHEAKPIIGFLGAHMRSPTDPSVAAFVARLRELGWTEDRNVAIQFRWWDGSSKDDLAQIIADTLGISVPPILLATADELIE